LAVMVDTFRPLLLTEHAAEIEEPDYYKSWLNGTTGATAMSQITS